MMHLDLFLIEKSLLNVALTLLHVTLTFMLTYFLQAVYPCMAKHSPSNHPTPPHPVIIGKTPGDNVSHNIWYYFQPSRWIHDYQDACVDKLEQFLTGEQCVKATRPSLSIGSSLNSSTEAHVTIFRMGASGEDRSPPWLETKQMKRDSTRRASAVRTQKRIFLYNRAYNAKIVLILVVMQRVCSWGCLDGGVVIKPQTFEVWDTELS